MVDKIPTRNYWKDAQDVLQDAAYVRMDPPFWATATDTQALSLPGWLADVHLPRRVVSAAIVFAATTDGRNLALPIIMPKMYPHFFTSIRNVTHPAIVRWIIAFCREAGISQRATMYTTLAMQGLGIPCDNGIVDRPRGWKPNTRYWDFMTIITGAATSTTYRSQGYRVLAEAETAIEAGQGMEWITERISRRRTTVRTLELVARTVALWRIQEDRRSCARVTALRVLRANNADYEKRRSLVRRYYERLETQAKAIITINAGKCVRDILHCARIERQWRRNIRVRTSQRRSTQTQTAQAA